MFIILCTGNCFDSQEQNLGEKKNNNVEFVKNLTRQHDTIYLLASIGLPPGGSSTVHIYTQYTERHKSNTTYNNTKILEECGPCPVLVSYTLAFALQLRKRHGKTSVRVAEQ